jgi:hypothetical protein
MLREGVPKGTRKQAWRVLSAALSWAASSNLVGEIRTNGCSFAPEPRGNIRRSLRSGGTGYEPGPRRHGPLVPAWALSPQAVEAIRAQMLARTEGRKAILARRDAMIVSLQYGLCARNQEVWGLRWSSLKDGFAWVLEVLSQGRLDEWSKTEHSTQRRTAIPSLLQEDLAEWRSALQAIGHPARELDFIIPGDLACLAHGERDPRTGACHFSENQAGDWGQRFFTPAVEKAALQPELLQSSAPPPTPCATAAFPCAYAPRTHKPSPASAAPAYARSASTTPTRSKTSAATDHAPQTPSGAPHAPNRLNAKH